MTSLFLLFLSLPITMAMSTVSYDGKDASVATVNVGSIYKKPAHPLSLQESMNEQAYPSLWVTDVTLSLDPGIQWNKFNETHVRSSKKLQPTYFWLYFL